MSGKTWLRQMMVSAFLLPALVCGTAFCINFIAMYYHASRAIPFGTMVAVSCICIFVILPLNLVGTVLGRNLAGNPDFPCRYSTLLHSSFLSLRLSWFFVSVFPLLLANLYVSLSLRFFNYIKKSSEWTPCHDLSPRRNGSWSPWLSSCWAVSFPSVPSSSRCTSSSPPSGPTRSTTSTDSCC